MQKVKHFLHVEWGGDSHARRHSEDAFYNLKNIEAGKGGDERAGDASLYGGVPRASRDGDWSESYVVRLIDWHLKEQETMPWLTGTAYWPFKDFRLRSVPTILSLMSIRRGWLNAILLRKKATMCSSLTGRRSR